MLATLLGASFIQHRLQFSRPRPVAAGKEPSDQSVNWMDETPSPEQSLSQSQGDRPAVRRGASAFCNTIGFQKNRPA